MTNKVLFYINALLVIILTIMMIYMLKPVFRSSQKTSAPVTHNTEKISAQLPMPLKSDVNGNRAEALIAKNAEEIIQNMPKGEAGRFVVGDLSRLESAQKQNIGNSLNAEIERIQGELSVRPEGQDLKTSIEALKAVKVMLNKNFTTGTVKPSSTTSK